MAHYYIKKNGISQRFEPLKKDGTPYKVISKKVVAQYGAKIGITTQLKNHLDTGFLFGWASRLGIDAAFEAASAYITGVLKMEAFKDFDDATKTYAKELFNTNSTKAADKGTEIHDAIDSYLKGGSLSDDPILAKAQESVSEWIKSKGVDLSEVKTEHCVVFEGGIVVPTDDGGGIKYILGVNNGATADLITTGVLADWKTIECAKDGKWYTGKIEHCAQLAFCRHAAADEGKCSNSAACFNVYLDRATGKIVEVKKWTEKQLDAGMQFVARCYECDKAMQQLEEAVKE